ncbi:MAG: acetyl-CoA carboxylase biotin carboxyl carrier protein [Gemmatimonadetes bacterium]|nr:acetyl-CoA carboxylase biotin carboxyl carrier protein [Gemmatimonadota bacterium]
MIDLDWIRRLIDMVDGSGIDSLEISRFGTRVRIAKSPPVTVSTAAASAMPVAAATAAPAEPQPLTAPDSEDGEDSGSGLVEVNSPMVGTFYLAPAPDAPPYVETGDRVEKGQTVCILEAMKLMNELEAEVSGTIREICVENAEPVEFGQVLFRIDPT